MSTRSENIHCTLMAIDIFKLDAARLLAAFIRPSRQDPPVDQLRAASRSPDLSFWKHHYYILLTITSPLFSFSFSLRGWVAGTSHRRNCDDTRNIFAAVVQLVLHREGAESLRGRSKLTYIPNHLRALSDEVRLYSVLLIPHLSEFRASTASPRANGSKITECLCTSTHPWTIRPEPQGC